jgi:hypothetical protein
MPNFRTFWLKTQLSSAGKSIVSAGSASDNASVSFQDTAPISVSHVGLRNLGYKETVYWRNLRSDRPSQTCTNIIGGYVCTTIDQELAAIGYGGQTVDGTELRNELMVVSDNKDSCDTHLLPGLPGRLSPGSVVIGSRLYVWWKLWR